MKRSNKLFLVVEDFEDSRFMMRRLLEMAGYNVLEASDGEQAVQMAVDSRPALILMDLSLPKLDGLSATRQIRQQ
jgi:CheY-like chemotaxis protein